MHFFISHENHSKIEKYLIHVLKQMNALLLDFHNTLELYLSMDEMAQLC